MVEQKPGRRQAAALKYDGGKDRAPRVVAAGQGFVAQEIIARAQLAGIPIQEDDALVGALCQIEVGREIPPELYEGVAKVLAFIIALDEQEARAGQRGD